MPALKKAKKKYCLNSALEQSGVWVTESRTDIRWKVKRHSIERNSLYLSKITAYFKDDEAQSVYNNLPQEERLRVDVTMFVESSIVDWGNVQDDETGLDVPFDPQEAIEYFLEAKEAYIEIKSKAEKIETFDKEEDLKNSPPLSSTTKSSQKRNKETPINEQ